MLHTEKAVKVKFYPASWYSFYVGREKYPNNNYLLISATSSELLYN